MVARMKLLKIGDSLGLLIPKEELSRMRVEEGDVLFGVPNEQGLQLQPLDPKFEYKLKAFEKTRKRYKSSLNQLAK